MVQAHLRKERFPRGEYSKIKLMKIGPCKILRKFLANACELDLPTGIGISPLFNLENLYPYQAQVIESDHDQATKEVQWQN